MAHYDSQFERVEPKDRISRRGASEILHIGKVSLQIFGRRPPDEEGWAPLIKSPTDLGGPDALPEPSSGEVDRGITEIQQFLGEKSLALLA